MDKYLASNGYTIRLAPISFGVPGGGNPWTICGLAPSTMTVAQRITCEKPYLAAMVAHMHALSPSVTATTIIAAHEPVEVDATSTGQTLSVADWHTLLAGLCPGIHAATGGSGITCSSGYSMADGAYVTNVTSSVPSGMQALGLDVYFRSFDSTPSWSNQPGVYQGWASSAIGAGLQVQIDEAGPPGYCPNGSGVGCNGNLIWGCAGPQMETYNANGAFSSWLFRWASAIGATVATLFNTGPMSLLQNGSCTDTSTSGYTNTMLNSIPSVPTITGYEWLAASRWGRQTRQGKTVVSGKIVQ
jgi:hypothetical protein